MPTLPPVQSATRPILRPGLIPIARDAGRLQIGPDSSPVGAVIVRDDPAVTDLLGRLTDHTTSWRTPTDPCASSAFADLCERGFIVAAPQNQLELRLAGQHGLPWPERTAARAAATVVVSGDLALAEPMVALLGAEGIAATARPLDQVGRALDSGAPDLEAILGTAPIRRDYLDSVTHPFLIVDLRPDINVVGPLVMPGYTACLRCIDATHAGTDPRWGWLVDQYARHTLEPWEAPRSACSDHLVTALATREVVSWIDGDLPTTWSATLTVTATGAPARTEWQRHPSCSCVWDLVVSDEAPAETQF